MGEPVIVSPRTTTGSTVRLDPALVPMEWIERLVRSPVVEHRMCGASLLWDLAESMPGIVPIDLVGQLAKPISEDWYVFAPAIAAIKQLSLTRRSALQVLLNLRRSLSAEDRHAAVSALRDLARVEAALVPRGVADQLAADDDPDVSEQGQALLSAVGEVTDAQRQDRHGRFGL